MFGFLRKKNGQGSPQKDVCAQCGRELTPAGTYRREGRKYCAECHRKQARIGHPPLYHTEESASPIADRLKAAREALKREEEKRANRPPRTVRDADVWLVRRLDGRLLVRAAELKPQFQHLGEAGCFWIDYQMAGRMGYDAVLKIIRALRDLPGAADVRLYKTILPGDSAPLVEVREWPELENPMEYSSVAVFGQFRPNLPPMCVQAFNQLDVLRVRVRTDAGLPLEQTRIDAFLEEVLDQLFKADDPAPSAGSAQERHELPKKNGFYLLPWVLRVLKQDQRLNPEPVYGTALKKGIADAHSAWDNVQKIPGNRALAKAEEAIRDALERTPLLIPCHPEDGETQCLCPSVSAARRINRDMIVSRCQMMTAGQVGRTGLQCLDGEPVVMWAWWDIRRFEGAGAYHFSRKIGETGQVDTVSMHGSPCLGVYTDADTALSAPGVSQDAALAVITLEDAIRLLTDHPEWDGLVINPNTDRYFYLSTAALTAPKRMYE